MVTSIDWRVLPTLPRRAERIGHRRGTAIDQEAARRPRRRARDPTAGRRSEVERACRRYESISPARGAPMACLGRDGS
jgi:hypothetical protein